MSRSKSNQFLEMLHLRQSTSYWPQALVVLGDHVYSRNRERFYLAFTIMTAVLFWIFSGIRAVDKANEPYKLDVTMSFLVFHFLLMVNLFVARKIYNEADELKK